MSVSIHTLVLYYVLDRDEVAAIQKSFSQAKTQLKKDKNGKDPAPKQDTLTGKGPDIIANRQSMRARKENQQEIERQQKEAELQAKTMADNL